MKLGITTKGFTATIEELVRTHQLSYMEAILFFCQERDIEPERIVRYIDPSVKEKIQLDAESLNRLKGPKTTKLPL